MEQWNSPERFPALLIHCSPALAGGGKPVRNSFTRDPEQRIAVNTNRVPVSVPEDIAIVGSGNPICNR